MKVKDLYKKYKDYDIQLVGKPIKEKYIPFTFLPKDKPLKECEVVEYEIIESERTIIGINFKTMKPIKPYKIKGIVYAYVK